MNTQTKRPIFIYLLLLTLFFFLLEVGFFIQCNQDYFSDFDFVSKKLQLPLTLLPGIIGFVAAQIFLHLFYCCFVWAVTQLIANLLRLSAQQTFTFGIIVWFLGLATILAANCYYFPNSKFSELISFGVNANIAEWLLYILLAGCLVIVLLAVVRLLWLMGCMTIVIAVLLTAAFVLTYKHAPSPVYATATASKPNIIIVGIDSLRPDFLSYFGGARQTPFLDDFLRHATVFTESFTPLARTFPSWVGILTGQYPKQSGVRYNLANLKNLHLHDTLPALLQREGYETIFATDETRFSNIDQRFGFDKVVTPPIGLNDFLLGTFNDFPLSNLVINSHIGTWLFPYSYANRPAYFSYQPDSFLNLVESHIAERQNKPLFLAIHFCLPHYPYVWAGLPLAGKNAVQRYQAAILRVDRQAQDFFTFLFKLHLLEHAVVVILSDHGEAIELDGDRVTEQELFISRKSNQQGRIPLFYSSNEEGEMVNRSAGHGTDVLGLTQYHTLLAFRLYGMKSNMARDVPGVVSLLDIKPTVLTLTHISYPLATGHSLADVIQDQTKYPMKARLFLESDYSPAAIKTVYPDARKVMLEGVELFQVDPMTTWLTVRPSMGEMIIASKQYAEIDGQWILALYPQRKGLRMPILVNLVTGEWTNDLQTAFAKASPAAVMLQSMNDFYKGEIGVVENAF